MVCHLAAQAGVRYSLENPFAYGRSNVMGFLQVLEHCRHRGVGNLVYASSSSVYGANEKVPFSEEDRVERPVSLYAATKVADELMARTYHHLFAIPVTGLRFFTVYGPWGRPDMALYGFTDKILSRRPIDVYNFGDMERDFTYVDDMVAGVVAAMDRPLGCEVVNLGNSRDGAAGPLHRRAGGRPGREGGAETYVPMQPGDVPRTFADGSKTRRLLGWEPTTVLEEGVPRFVAWYREYHGVTGDG